MKADRCCRVVLLEPKISPVTAQVQMKEMFSREEGGINLKDGRGRAGIQGDSILENRVEIRRVFNYPPLGQMVVLVKWA